MAKKSTTKKTTTVKKTSSKPKKSKNGFIMDNEDIDIHSVKYDTINAEEVINKRMGIYSFNINLERALPNVRDGLKPSQRVVVYTGHSSGFRNAKPFRKSLRFIGNGSKYYVHGDASFYSTMMSLAKPFYTKFPLIEVHGNYGNVTGDDAAAPRYTESRLSNYAEDLLKSFTKESTDWKDNYDNTEKQPTVLPAEYPNLLLNGAFGIGQGYLGSIPSHNFEDIARRAIMLIKNPDISIDDLIDGLIPDYPIGGVIINKKDLPIIYKTGNNPEELKKLGYKSPIPIRMRGKVTIDEKGNLIITSIPYMKNTGALKDSIQNAIKEEKITGISEIKDGTNSVRGINIKLIIKRGYDPKMIEQNLYKYTILQDSIATQFLCTTPDMLHFRYYNFKEILEEWLQFRKVTLKRLFNSNISKIKRQIHIDEGLLIALDKTNIDDIIEMIKKAKGIDDIIAKLIKTYSLTTIQAEYIADLRLSQLCNMEIEKIKEDLEQQKVKLEDNISYFKDKDKLNNYIIESLEKGIKKYNTPRLTEAVDVNSDNIVEEAIENTNHTLFLTAEGFLKKIDGDKIRVQNTKGCGINIGKMKENDYVISTLNVENLDDLLFFTNQGRLLSMKVYNVKDSNLNSYGILLESILSLKEKEKVVAVMRGNNEKTDSSYLLFATRKGLIKKTSSELYKNIPKAGFSAIDLNEGDELVGVKHIEQDMDVVVATKNGYIIRYNTATITPTKRTTKGVKSIVMSEGDSVVAFDVFSDEDDMLFVLTSKGNGKRIDMKTLLPTDRTKKTKPLARLTDKEEIVATFFVNDEDEITIVGSKKVIKIPASQVPILMKSNSGKLIVKLAKGEKVLVGSK